MDDVLTTEIMLDAFSQVNLEQLYHQMQASEEPPTYPAFQMPVLAPAFPPLADKQDRRVVESFKQVVSQGRKSSKYLAQAQALYETQPSAELGLFIGHYLSQWDLTAFQDFQQDYRKTYPEGDFNLRMRCLVATVLLEGDRALHQPQTLTDYKALLHHQESLVADLNTDSDAATVMDAYFAQAIWNLALNVHHAHTLYFLNAALRLRETYGEALELCTEAVHLEDALLYWFQCMSDFYEAHKDFYLPLVSERIAQYL